MVHTARKPTARTVPASVSLSSWPHAAPRATAMELRAVALPSMASLRLAPAATADRYNAAATARPRVAGCQHATLARPTPCASVWGSMAARTDAAAHFSHDNAGTHRRPHTPESRA